MKKYIYILIILAVLGGIIWLVMTPGTPGKLDDFAKCLGDKGAIFYGAFWCPHCQAQKALFGKSAKLLPYIECSTPDGKSQLPLCVDKNVTNYPTWHFATTSATPDILTGEIPLETLAEKTGCALPQ